MRGWGLLLYSLIILLSILNISSVLVRADAAMHRILDAQRNFLLYLHHRLSIDDDA